LFLLGARTRKIKRKAESSALEREMKMLLAGAAVYLLPAV
jgi:hypothetical protein